MRRPPEALLAVAWIATTVMGYGTILFTELLVPGLVVFGLAVWLAVLDGRSKKKMDSENQDQGDG
jgi:Flp pilus assembly protein TadB